MNPTLLVAAVLAVHTGPPGARAAESSPGPVAMPALEATLDRLATALLRESPTRATSLGVSEEVAGDKYSHRLEDESRAGLERRARVVRDFRAELERLDRARLSPSAAISHGVVVRQLDSYIAAQRFGYGNYGASAPTPYVVTQLQGAYTDVPDFLNTRHRVRDRGDAEDYVARLSAYARILDQESARIREDARKGVIPPDFALEGALRALRALAAQPPADTVLVRALARKLGEAGIDAAAAKALRDRAEQVVRGEVLPAYRRQVQTLEALLPKATHDAGVWRLPEGAAYYQVALRHYNTTDLTAEDIHALGLRMVGELRTEMDALLRAQGLTDGSVSERMQRLANEPAQQFPDSEEGRARLLAELNRQVEALEPKLPEYFGVLARTPLDIRRVPPEIEAGAPAGYYQSGSLDGTRPGAYYINLRRIEEWPRFRLPTLTYHEGNPGHHWQISIALQSEELHLIRRGIFGFSGYSEGWGLYAEQLADEIGMYRDDPTGRLGYLQSMMFRAARLVVDTGLHARRWSREQAIDYMVETTGDARTKLAAEVERYAVNPGQATAYMVGREAINRLRARARESLGERFDLRAFHDLVLTSGSMPLSLLEEVVNAWIAERQGSSAAAG